MEYDVKLIGQRIKKARRAKRYTQEYVADKVNIGEKFLSQIECGKSGLSVQTLMRLCETLEVSPGYILLSDCDRFMPDPFTDLLKGLSAKQLYDAEELLRIFVRNCNKNI